MILVLLGIVAGVAVGIGKLPGFAAVGDSLSDAAVDLGYRGVEAIVKLADFQETQKAVAVARIIIVALMPGVVSGVLMAAARSGVVLRRTGAALSILGAVAIFFTQDMPEGAVAAIVLLGVGLLFAFVVGSLLSFVASAIASLMATVQIRAALEGGAGRFNAAADQLVETVGVGDVQFWAQALSIAAAILPVMVLWTAFRD
jgi:hypothetical protein